jgi:NADPH-dependent curcumin reductase CurA
VGQKNRDIRLRHRPTGLPQGADFELFESDTPSPNAGQILVKNLVMSVDPYMRGRMVDRKSYVTPFQIGEVLQGGAVGKVMASNNHPGFAAGDYVLSTNGWREWFVSDGEGLMKLDTASMPVKPGGERVGLGAYLGALGMPGLTAYVGLKRIGELKKEDRVFVSAASGAVGAVACQIARNVGCDVVVGSAGSAEKCTWLEGLGIRAFNYHDFGDLGAALAYEMPGGIDVYFDNVGGAHLIAALDNMRDFGRVVACGMIEHYNATERPRGPHNLMNVVARRLTMRGFIVLDHFDMMQRFAQDMHTWVSNGEMTWRETIVDGIENAPDALIGLFTGKNFGKMLVKLAEEDA